MNNRSASQARYDAAHTQRLQLKLNTSTDADILSRLEREPSKQGYIKALIRADIGGDSTMTYRHYLRVNGIQDSKDAWAEYLSTHLDVWSAMPEPMQRQHVDATWLYRFAIQF